MSIDLFCIAGMDGYFKYVNPAWEKILGYSEKELLSRPFLEFIHPKDHKKNEAEVAKLAKGKITVDFENRFIHKNGTLRTISWTATPDKEEKLMYCVGRDITEKKEKEEELRAAKEFAESLIETANVIILTLDKNANLITFNKFAETLTGYKKTEVLGKNWFKLFIPHRLRKEIPEVFEDVLNEMEEVSSYENPILCKNRKERLISWKNTIIKGNDGEIEGVLSIGRDITEQKKAEENLWESEENYKSMVELAPDAILTMDRKGFLTSWNSAFLELTGYSAKDFENIHFTKIPTLMPKDMPKHAKTFTSILRGKIKKPVEFRWMHKDGSIRWGETHVSTLKKDGRTTGFQVFIRDTTERRKAEEALRESEERYRLLITNATEAIAAADENGKLLVLNKAGARILGGKPGDFIGKTLYDILPKKIADERMANVRQVIKTGKGRVTELTLPIGNEQQWFRQSTQPIRDESGKIHSVLSISTDITDLKRAEKALLENEEKYHSIFENIRDVYYETSLDGTILEISPSIQRIAKYKRENLIGKSVWTLYADPRQREKLLEKILDEGELNDYEITLIDKDGKEVTASINIILVKDEKGTPIMLRGSLRNISERKETEEKLKASLKEKELLLKEIHHRVKNNMQIMSSLLRLQSEGSPDKQTKEMFKESQNRIRSMALIHDTLYKSENFAKINFDAYLNKVITHLVSTYQMDGLDIIFNLDIKDIFLNINQAIPLGLIINELVSNSLKHAFVDRQSGNIIVRMKNKGSDRHELSIRDDGIGFPDDLNLQNATSLGLQLVNDLIWQLEGTIKLIRGEGTTFKITVQA